MVQYKSDTKCPNLCMKQSGFVTAALQSSSLWDRALQKPGTLLLTGWWREFELSRGSLDSSMWKIRTICWQRGQIGGIRKIIPPLPPPRHAANGLQCPGPLPSSPSLSQDITSWLVSKKEKKEREYSLADKRWEQWCPPWLWDCRDPPQGANLCAI